MPGTPSTTVAAGFNDQVGHHLVRVFGNALLLSIFRGFTGSTAGKAVGDGVGQELGQTSTELIGRGIASRRRSRSGPATPST